MRKEPDIDRNRLVDILKSRFGIETRADELVFNAEGKTAASYLIDAQGQRYIVKQWPEHFWRGTVERRLQLVSAIHERVYPYVAYAIPVRDGSTYTTSDSTPLAVFPFIEGRPPIWSRKTAVALGKAIAAVHRARKTLEDVLPPETDTASEIREELQQLLQQGQDDPALSDMLAPWRDKIMATLDRIGELANTLSTSDGREVVCHMDLHPNNLIENEAGLHILDWDESVMAPPEHDLFSSHGPRFADFIDSYIAAGGFADLDVRQFEFVGLRTLLDHVRYGLYLFTNEHNQREGKSLLKWALPRFDDFEDQQAAISAVVEKRRFHTPGLIGKESGTWRQPDFHPDVFREILRDRYGIAAETFAPAARGTTGSSYVIAAGGERYFLKRWIGERDAFTDAGLRLATAIRDRQIYDRVACALPMSDGALHGVDGRTPFAVFPFIEGTPPSESAVTCAALGEAIAAWHRATPSLGDVLPPSYKPTIEFEVRFRETFSQASTDPVLGPIVGPWREKILSTLQGARELEASLLLSSHRPPVVCHMDLRPASLLANAGGLYVLGWDKAALAPPEYDLYAGRGPFFADLLQAYVAAGGTARLDPRQFALIARRDLLGQVDSLIFRFLRTRDEDCVSTLSEQSLPRFDTLDDEVNAIAGVIGDLRPDRAPARGSSPAAAPVRKKLSLALGFATIDRPHVVQRLVRSVRRRYPDMPIYVADQSRQIEPMQAFYDAFDVHVIHVPYDAGVAASRNAVVAAMTETYFVLCDDDMFLGRETAFEDAVDVLEHHPELAVVGGKLYDHQPSGMWDRHWELLFAHDPDNRMLITMPIYWMAPRILKHRDLTLYRCDAVLNFAVFRRSIFSDTVRWDERFTCNGEHEDFYLNLKLNTSYKVAYLPTMVGFHNHPTHMPDYEERLRMRQEGWRLYLEKWDLDQQLEEGTHVRTRDDIEPSIYFEEMRERFSTGRPTELAGYGPLDDDARLAEADELMGTVPPASNGKKPVIPEAGELFIVCAPAAGGQIYLWCLWNASVVPDAEADLRLRWYAEDGQVLVWESEPIMAGIRPAPYWQPYLLDLPPRSPRWNYVRFEVLGRGEGGTRILATGYLADGNAQPAFRDGSVQVLGLSAAPGEAPSVSPRELVVQEPVSLAYRFLGDPDGRAGLALIELADVPADVSRLQFDDWERLPGDRLQVALPPAHLRGASAMAVPCRAAGPGDASISATTGQGERIAFALGRTNA